MVIVIGLILIALGISLAVEWSQQFLMALQGLTALSFLVLGLVAVLVGYSEMKARREYNAAVLEPGPKSEHENAESPSEPSVANTS